MSSPSTLAGADGADKQEGAPKQASELGDARRADGAEPRFARLPPITLAKGRDAAR